MDQPTCIEIMCPDLDTFEYILFSLSQAWSMNDAERYGVVVESLVQFHEDLIGASA